MTDRVYPSSKPNGTTTKATTTKTTTAAAATTTKPNSRLPPPPPPKKTQQIPNRHPDRPNPIPTNRQQTSRNRHRTRRGCFCLCCFWSILIILLLLLIATVAGCILYLLYHPHRPTFSIAALKISQFNLTTDDTTTTTHLTSKLNLTISTTNPNKKIQFHYDPISVTCLSHETLIANGSFPNQLVISPNNVTVIRSSLSSSSVLLLDTEKVNQLRFHIKNNNNKKAGLPLKIVMDTSVRVEIGSVRTKKVGIRIKCEGMHSLIPKKGRNSTSLVVAESAIVSDAKCKMDLRVKIWKWNF